MPNFYKVVVRTMDNDDIIFAKVALYLLSSDSGPQYVSVPVSRQLVLGFARFSRSFFKAMTPSDADAYQNDQKQDRDRQPFRYVFHRQG